MLHSTRWGCIAWQLQPVRSGLLKYFTLKRAVHGADLPWQLLHVNSLGDCKAAKLKALPPAAQVGTARDKPCPGGIVFSLDGPIENLAVFAARTAFMPLTVPFMEELLPLLKVPNASKVPKRERDLAECLVRHMLPELSAAEVNDIVQLRTFRKCAAQDHLESELLKGDNLENLEGILDDDDFEALKATKARRDAGGAAASSSSGAAASSSGAPAAPAAPPDPPAREKVSLKGSLTPDWAKNLLPQVKGCVLTLDTVRHFRWAVRYDRKPEAPRGFSKAFGRGETNMTSAQSFRLCFEWAWQVHSDVTGDTCPFELTD